MATTLTKTGKQVKIERGDEIFIVPVNSSIWKSPWNANMIIIDPESNFSVMQKGINLDWTEITGIEAATRDEMVGALALIFNESDEELLEEVDSSIDAVKAAVDLVKTAIDENKAKVVLNTTAVDAVKTAASDGTQKTQNIDYAGHPGLFDIADDFDSTDGTVIYRGYIRGASYLVAKQVIGASTIATTWATGAWADRLTLSYS